VLLDTLLYSILFCEGNEMTERAEWEVVDESSPPPRPTMQQLMQRMLGRWWRWKIAALATVGALAVVFFATVIGVILLLLVSVGILTIAIGKLMRWLRKSDGSIAVRRDADK
jgi:hypothetical protein